MAANDICRNKRLLSISRHLASAGDTGLGMQSLLDKLGQLDDDMQSRSGRKSVLPSKETDSRARSSIKAMFAPMAVARHGAISAPSNPLRPK